MDIFVLQRRAYHCSLFSSGIMLPSRTIQQRRECSSRSSHSGSILARLSMCAMALFAAVYLGVRFGRQGNGTFLSLGDRWPAHQCLRIHLAGQVHHGRGSVPNDKRLMLMQNSLMAVRDLKAAYHLVRYSGCRVDTRYLVRRTTNHAQSEYVARRTMQSGCDPGDCLGWCNKSLMALCVEGHVGRFVAARFEHKIINTGLAIVTGTAVVYASKELELDSGAFVDDFLHCIIVLAHLLCAGFKLAGGCPICQAALDAAQKRFDALDQIFTDCAPIFSTKGDMSVSQRHTFLGIIFDTHRGRLYITAEKFDKLMMLLRERMNLVSCSPRSMAKLRGKAQPHFRCLEGVRPFLSRFYRFIGGPESVFDWDLEKEVSGVLRHVMWFLF
jgi:hypothetical protein